MQPGEREPGLRFPAGDRQHPHARPPGPAGRVRQQHGLAHPRLAGDDQDLSGRGDRIHQCGQPGQPGLPADDGCGVLGGEFTGTWHLPVLSAGAFRQRRPQAQQRPWPGHARGGRVSDQAWQNSFYVAVSASARASLRCVTACLEDFRGDLATISIPVLVIHGDQDRVLPYEATSSRLPALLKNARSTIIAGGPHAIIWTHADEVSQALLDFIGHLSRAWTA